MFANHTPAVARALQAAQRWARAQGAAEVHPEHLLYGLLEEEEGRAASLLARTGLDPAFVRRKLTDRPPVGAALPADMPLLFSPRTENALSRAHSIAVESADDRTLGSGQLLLALLQQDEPLRGQLESEGWSVAHLEVEVTGAPGPPLLLEEPLQLGETPEEFDTARILDANANRAREALRVIEDYCRFVLADAFLSGRLKQLRHDLREALADLPAGRLLEARDTVGDVGTGITTAAEQERDSLMAVVQANCKRLQEALRCLEEYGKLRGSELGHALETLRYQSYTLERAIVLGAGARQRLAEARLYVLLTGATCAASLDWTIAEAAAGGAQMVQLREKTLADRDLLDRARQVRRWTRQTGILFIMNDRPDLARLADADGVHLGQDELPVHQARRILGPEALVGVSTHNLEQVRRAVLDGASYIGVGPTFPSSTKNFAEFPGLEFARQAAAETSLPAFIIGGVTAANIDQVIAVGGRRVAVSHAVCAADEPRLAAAALRKALAQVRIQ
jgi:thiamine-phosphate pyrophosphorylase